MWAKVQYNNNLEKQRKMYFMNVELELQGVNKWGK